MESSTLAGFCPLETLLAQRRGNFADVLAFAAHRASMAPVHDAGPDSTKPTIPAPPPGR